MNAPYACRFVADKRSVSLVEIAASENERTVRVATGAGPGWQVVLPVWYLPSVAILGDTVAVWAATRLYLLVPGRDAVRADFDDEVHAVYAVESKFCVVGELSVFVYDPDGGAVVDRLQAEDVLGGSWWEGDRLFVACISGPVLTFRISGGSLYPEAPDENGSS